MTTIPLPNKTYTHIIQLSDIHFGARVKPEEFRHAFKKVHKFLDGWDHIETTLCVITGDVFHHHAREHADVYALAMECLNPLLRRVPTLIIRGNHDIDIHAPERADSITAVFTSASTETFGVESNPSYLSIHPHTVLLKSTGLFQVGNLEFGHLDVLDASPQKADQLPAPSVGTDTIKIALCHATLRHSKFFSHEAFQDTYISLDAFKDYPIVLLGDVHKRQNLPTDTAGQVVAYPGSLIQLSYGEDPDEHGFTLWDLEKASASYVEIPPLIPKYNVVVNGDGEISWKLWRNPRKLQPFSQIPKTSKMPAIKLHLSPSLGSEKIPQIRETIRRHFPNMSELVQTTMPLPQSQAESKENSKGAEQDKDRRGDIYIPDIVEHYKDHYPTQSSEVLVNPLSLLDESSMETLKEWSKNTAHRSHREVSKKILEMIPKMQKIGETDGDRSRHFIRFINLSWKDLACFEGQNSIDLSENGIYGILGQVYSGKSSILDILALALFRRPMRQQDGSRSNSNHFSYYVRKGCTSYSISLVLEVDHNRYQLDRSHTNITRKIAAVDKLVQLPSDKSTDQKPIVIATEAKEIDRWIEANIGDMNDMLGSILMSQKNQFSFLNLTPQVQLDQIQQWLQLERMTLMSDFFAATSKFFEYRQNSLSSKIAELEAQRKINVPTEAENSTDTTTTTIESLQDKITILESQLAAIQEKRDDILSLLHARESMERELKRSQELLDSVKDIVQPTTKAKATKTKEKVQKDCSTEITKSVSEFNALCKLITDAKQRLERQSLNIDSSDQIHTMSGSYDHEKRVELETFLKNYLLHLSTSQSGLRQSEKQLEKLNSQAPSCPVTEEELGQWKKDLPLKKKQYAGSPWVDSKTARRLAATLLDLQKVPDTYKKSSKPTTSKKEASPDYHLSHPSELEKYRKEKQQSLYDLKCGIKSPEHFSEIVERILLEVKREEYNKIISDIHEEYDPKCEKCRARMTTDPEQYSDFLLHIEDDLKSLPERPKSCTTMEIDRYKSNVMTFEKKDRYWALQEELFASMVSNLITESKNANGATQEELISWADGYERFQEQILYWKTLEEKTLPAYEKWRDERVKLELKIDGIRKSIQNLQESITDTQSELQEMYKLQQYEEMHRSQVELDEYTEKQDAIKKNILKLYTDHKLYHDALEEQCQKMAKKTRSDDLANVTQETQKITSDIQETRQQIQKLKLYEEIKAKTEGQIKLYNTEYRQLNEWIKSCDHFESYLSKDNTKGYFRDVLMSVLPQIANSVNLCLQQIDPLQIILSLEAGGLKIELYDPEKDIKVTRSMWSGHQEFIVSLCFRIALSSYIGRATFGHMIIDEGWTASDEEHLEDLTSIFEILRNRFENVLLITHLKPVAHQADIVYNIVKKGTWSHLVKV